MAKKIEKPDEFIDEAGAEPRVYELGFHLDPELPQEEVKKAYQTIRDFIAGVGTVIAEGEPVKIPLAYTISRMETTGRRDFTAGFFCWIAYETDPEGHEKVGTLAREESRIVRFLDIRSSVEEAKHAADMQEMFAQLTAPEEEEETASEPESEAPAAPAAEEAA
jgi:ribosomal protein S6